MLNVVDVSVYLDRLRPFGTTKDFAWREGQKEAIIELLQHCDNAVNEVPGSKKVIELAAPTSAGKSVILWAFSKAAIHFGILQRSVITTPQKELVTQYKSQPNWFDGIVLGRSNYPCAMNSDLYADECICRSQKERDSAPECATCFNQEGIRHAICDHCEYEAAKNAFKAAKIGLTTMAYYLVGYAPDGRIECAIIDESSDLEKGLLDGFALSLPDSSKAEELKPFFNEIKDIKAYEGMRYEFKDNPNIPEKFLPVLEAYNAHLQKKLELINGELKPLQLEMVAGSKKVVNEVKRLSKDFNRVTRESLKMAGIINTVEYGIEHNEKKYYVTEDRKFKLLKADRLFAKLIKPLSFVILASGTPTTKTMYKDYARVEMAHPIEISRREFYINPVGSMTFKNRDKTMPILAKEIATLHNEKANGKHTIVHCHAYTIAASIEQYLKKCTKATIICQRNNEGISREVYKNGWINTPDSIFLSVAWHEGLDLKGPEFPLNILVKTPLMNPSDEWSALRTNLDQGEYVNLMAAVEIQQAAGRTTRSPDDYSYTVMLDSDIKWYLRKNGKHFEQYFKDAVRTLA